MDKNSYLKKTITPEFYNNPAEQVCFHVSRENRINPLSIDGFTEEMKELEANCMREYQEHFDAVYEIFQDC